MDEGSGVNQKYCNEERTAAHLEGSGRDGELDALLPAADPQVPDAARVRPQGVSVRGGHRVESQAPPKTGLFAFKSIL